MLDLAAQTNTVGSVFGPREGGHKREFSKSVLSLSVVRRRGGSHRDGERRREARWHQLRSQASGLKTK